MTKSAKNDQLFRVSDDGVPVAMHDFYKSNGMFHAGEINDEPSMARQEFAKECDINEIMKKYDKYLSDPMLSLREKEKMYVDFSSMPTTLMEAMDMFHVASEAFYRLPATVRREFDNDPALWADFASDDANIGKMVEWGLAAPEKVPEPIKVEVTNAPKEPPKGETKPPLAASTHVST